MRSQLSTVLSRITQLPSGAKAVCLLLTAVWIGLLPRPCSAQFGLLTTDEALQIAETLPEYREAKGGCPWFDILPSYDSRRVAFQVRAMCQPEGTGALSLIGSFAVDRYTGAISVWPAGPIISFPDVELVARSLVANARARALSEREGRCLALAAVSDDPNRVKLRLVSSREPDGNRQFTFVAIYGLPQSGVTGARLVTVEEGPLQVSDSRGEPLRSPALTKLASQLRVSREPVVLSPQEAISVALAVPSVLASARDMCSPQLSADFGTATTRYVTVEDTCEGSVRVGRTIAAVRVSDGTVTDPHTAAPLDTAASMALAHELLERASERRRTAEDAIQRACR